MTERYWVIGADFADEGFQRIVPGTETMAGPFANRDRASTEWRRLTFRDRIGAMTRFSIAVEPLAVGR